MCTSEQKHFRRFELVIWLAFLLEIALHPVLEQFDSFAFYFFRYVVPHIYGTV